MISVLAEDRDLMAHPEAQWTEACLGSEELAGWLSTGSTPSFSACSASGSLWGSTVLQNMRLPGAR